MLSSRLLQDDRLSASSAVGKQGIEIEQFQSIFIIAMINVKSLFLSSLVAYSFAPGWKLWKVENRQLIMVLL